MPWRIDPNPTISDHYSARPQNEQDRIEQIPFLDYIERTMEWMDRVLADQRLAETPDPFGILDGSGNFQWKKYQSSLAVLFNPSQTSPHELAQTDMRVRNFWDYFRRAIGFVIERTLPLDTLPSGFNQRHLRWDDPDNQSWNYGGDVLATTYKPIRYSPYDIDWGKPGAVWYNLHIPTAFTISTFGANQNVHSIAFSTPSFTAEQTWAHDALPLQQMNEIVFQAFQQKIQDLDFSNILHSPYANSAFAEVFDPGLFSPTSIRIVYSTHLRIWGFRLKQVRGFESPGVPSLEPNTAIPYFHYTGMADIPFFNALFVRSNGMPVTGYASNPGNEGFKVKHAQINDELKLYYRFMTHEEYSGNFYKDKIKHVLEDPGTQMGSVSLPGLVSYDDFYPEFDFFNADTWANPPQTWFDTDALLETPPQDADWLVISHFAGPDFPIPQQDFTGIGINAGDYQKMVYGNRVDAFPNFPSYAPTALTYHSPVRWDQNPILSPHITTDPTEPGIKLTLKPQKINLTPITPQADAPIVVHVHPLSIHARGIVPDTVIS